MKRFLLWLLTVAPLLSVAQSNFHKGYVVNNAQDTIRGFIDYKERFNNPTSIIFKSSTDSKPQTFLLKDYAAYGIDGLVRYQRFAVNISMDKVNLANLSVGIDSTSKRDTVFLQVLQTGKNVNLFAYQDAIKGRYYIQRKTDTEPEELIKHDYLSESNAMQVVTNTRYRRQLIRLLYALNMNSAANEGRVNSLDYKPDELIKFAAIINEQEVVKSKYKSFRFFAGTGVMISKAVFSGLNEFAGPDVSNKVYASPILTAGVDLFANPVIGKLIYRIELSLAKAKYEINKTNADPTMGFYRYSFDRTTVSINPQIIYNIYNADNLKAFLGGGFSVDVAGYSNHVKALRIRGQENPVIGKSDVGVETLNISFPFTAGIVLNKKIQLSAGYTLPSSITRAVYYSLDIQSYKIGVNYFFGSR